MGLDRPLSGRRKDGSLVFLELGLNVVPGAESRLIVACVVDVTQKHDLETSLAVATDESLGFQRLMADVAFMLAAAEPEEVDDSIVTGLHKMAETLNLDGAIVWQAAAGKTSMVPTHHWMPASCPPPRPFTVDDLPGVISKFQAGERSRSSVQTRCLTPWTAKRSGILRFRQWPCSRWRQGDRNRMFPSR